MFLTDVVWSNENFSHSNIGLTNLSETRYHFVCMLRSFDDESFV